MSKKKENKEKEVEEQLEEQVVDAQDQDNDSQDEEKSKKEPSMEDKYNELNDKFVRLYSEFENFRRRTARERLEMSNRAKGDALKEVLPVLDDLNRAITQNEKVEDVDALKEGFNLVQNKLFAVFEKSGVKKMEAKGEAFDPEIHEAVTKFPAPSDDLKGKIIDVIEDGYTIGDTVLRYAKVVVGE